MLSPLAKATKVVCGELDVGLSFIYPVIYNVINTTLCVQESDMGVICSFKNTVRGQLVTHFKVESDGLTESIPVVACFLDPCFKHLQFFPEHIREDARDHLHQLLQEERPAPIRQPQLAVTATGNITSSSDQTNNHFCAMKIFPHKNLFHNFAV